MRDPRCSGCREKLIDGFHARGTRSCVAIDPAAVLHEQEARARKVEAIAAVLVPAVRTLSREDLRLLRDLPQATRDLVAKGAGCRAPSWLTWERVIDRVSDVLASAEIIKTALVGELERARTRLNRQEAAR